MVALGASWYMIAAVCSVLLSQGQCRASGLDGDPVRSVGY